METWAIVELMGHVRVAGFVTEEERFGVKLGRVDIHDGDQCVTQYFGGASVYRITPVSEEIARHIGKNAPAPVQSWELPTRATPATSEAEQPEVFRYDPFAEDN